MSEAVLQALQCCPGHAKAYFRLSTALLQLQRTTEAVACLQSALRIHPGHRQLRAALAGAESAARAELLIERSASVLVRPMG